MPNKDSIASCEALNKVPTYIRHQPQTHQLLTNQDLHNNSVRAYDTNFVKHPNETSPLQRYHQRASPSQEYSNSGSNQQLQSSQQLLKVTQNPEHFSKASLKQFETSMNQMNPRHRRMSVPYREDMYTMPINQYGFSQMTHQHEMFQMRMYQHNLAQMSPNHRETARAPHHTPRHPPGTFSGLSPFPFQNQITKESPLTLEQSHNLYNLQQSHLLQHLSANGNKFSVNNDLDRLSSISGNPFIGYANPPMFGLNGISIGIGSYAQRSLDLPEYLHQDSRDQIPLSPRNAL